MKLKNKHSLNISILIKQGLGFFLDLMITGLISKFFVSLLHSEYSSILSISQVVVDQTYFITFITSLITYTSVSFYLFNTTIGFRVMGLSIMPSKFETTVALGNELSFYQCFQRGVLSTSHLFTFALPSLWILVNSKRNTYAESLSQTKTILSKDKADSDQYPSLLLFIDIDSLPEHLPSNVKRLKQKPVRKKTKKAA